jgi:dienelactone hydrolase
LVFYFTDRLKRLIRRLSPEWRCEGANRRHLCQKARPARLHRDRLRRILLGESTGEPRQLENPHIRIEDVSAVVDYLTTLPYVDQERIGGRGTCAGAGYTANAAINDPRIKAVGTVNMVNIGQMSRNGFTGEVKRQTQHRCL